MRRKHLVLIVLSVLFLMGTSACSPGWHPFSQKEKGCPSEKGNCQIEGYLFFKGKAPSHLPVLQNEKGQWRLTGLDPKKMTKYQRKKVLVQGECLETSGEEIWLLPEIQVFSIDILEKD